ncbi:MAG: DUF4832 domain-containing protein [Bacteroidota bacterium]
MKRSTAIILLLVFISLGVLAQNRTISYEESQEDITNPERGFYIPSGTKASNFILLNGKELSDYRNTTQHLKGASYAVNISLLYRAYELDTFKMQPLSQSFLSNLQKDFDAVRAAGLKVILRFAYTNTTHGGDCKDEYKICPPYGDAPRHIVLKHVQQLKPLFYKNADVIAVLQQGFIGIWGENYFTDYFGCGTNDGSGVIADSSWLHRNQFLKALLDAMPKNRMVQVRTPQIKQRFVYGPKALPNSATIDLKQAFTGIEKSRIGFHNDCFLASEDDYGTFYDYGNSSGKRDTANKRLRQYFESDSRYTAVGGETCDDAFSPQNDCAPFGYAVAEMAAMHYSYLNAAYNNQVNNDWDSLGCMKTIKEKLGYRLVLTSATFPAKIKKGEQLNIQVKLKNDGFASPFNPRPVQLLLRNTKTKKVYTLAFNTQIQKWFSGNISLKQNFTLPASITKGSYELLLNLPDDYKQLQGNALYNIQMANVNTWEPSTGYNKLNAVFLVE